MDEPGTVRVVVLGDFTTEWMMALGPSSLIWKSIPVVGEVVVVGEKEDFLIPPPKNLKNKLSIIVPLLEQHIQMLPAHLPDGFAALVPSEKSLHILWDKALFAEFMEANGFSDHIPRRINDVLDSDFPVIVKKPVSMAGHGVAIVKSRADLSSLTSQEGWDDPRVVLQAYLENRTEYVTHAICDEGRLVWNTSFAYEVRGDHPIKTEFSKVKTRQAATFHEVKCALEQILKALSFNGPISANYKLVNDRPVFLEINPRFGGSMMWFSHNPLLIQAMRALIDVAVAQNSRRLIC